MNAPTTFDALEVGYDVPALPGMDEADIQTPCLVLDLDALERNIRKMGDYARAHGMRHRVHGKMHKSVDVAKLQERLGGAVGVCCQKVSEAEVFVRGGIKDVLVSNQVRDPAKIDRLARLPGFGARIIVCVDDLANVAELSAAARKHGTVLEIFVEIDCGARRSGAPPELAGDLEIALFQAGDKVYLQGRIVELPSSAVEREDVMDNCLRKHLGQQGTRQEVLCLEPDGAALMMYRMLPARSLDAVGFERALGEFANALDHWMAETGAENRVAYSPSTMRMLFP